MHTNNSSKIFQPLLFTHEEFSSCCFTEPTEKELEFKSYLDFFYGIVPESVKFRKVNRFGRPSYSLFQVLAVWLVKLVYNEKTITNTLETINGNNNLRTIIGYDDVPSASVISRRTAELKTEMNCQNIHDLLCKEFYKDRIVGNLSIDSTVVAAREKPVKNNTKKVKGKRGRKKIGSKEAEDYRLKKEKEEKNKNFQEKGDIWAYIATFCILCSITGKKNSKGNMQWTIGYKIHLATDDFGIPVAYIITGANIHDTQPAISLLRLAGMRCVFLYALMDGGYSSIDISDFVYSMNAIPVIDMKADRNGKKIEMDAAKTLRYKARTTVERTNGEMKECFLANKLYSRGTRAIFEMELAVLLITIKKMNKVLCDTAQIQQSKAC